MFQGLDSLGLKVNPNKCKLCESETEFLGHTYFCWKDRCEEKQSISSAVGLNSKNSEGYKVFP